MKGKYVALVSIWATCLSEAYYHSACTFSENYGNNLIVRLEKNVIISYSKVIDNLVREKNDFSSSVHPNDTPKLTEKKKKMWIKHKKDNYNKYFYCYFTWMSHFKHSSVPDIQKQSLTLYQQVANQPHMLLAPTLCPLPATTLSLTHPHQLLSEYPYCHHV